MKIITVRRISQIFFFLVFVWFCIAATLGQQWWQLRGWPVNWLIQLDPLNGLGVLLATHTLYAGLLWGVLTIALTFVLGRFFCGWICPLGAAQQFAGYLGKRGNKASRKIARNQPHKAQQIKYWILLFLLAAAGADLLGFFMDTVHQKPLISWGLALCAIAGLLVLSARQIIGARPRSAWGAALLVIVVIGFAQSFPDARWLAASLQTGLLDPLAMAQRSFNLVLLPFVDNPLRMISSQPRVYSGAGLIGVLFLVILLLSLRRPRFYCRFICPTGALLGLLSRWAVWRIGKADNSCDQCRLCEADCEGACAPTAQIQTHECVLCFNCRNQCRHHLLAYAARPSAAGEQRQPDLSRRRVLAAAVSGFAAVPFLRLGGKTGAAWNPDVIRPPGALEEAAFLSRCIKCGQCMRICPTNVIHPAGLEAGLEGLWTPVLKYRLGTSGCQYNCVACSRICPTAAIRPLRLAERMGRDAFAVPGPLRLGTAFIDRGRCLPWSMDTPCIVCQENCPVSPKAIFTRTQMHPLPKAVFRIHNISNDSVVLTTEHTLPSTWGSGDYYCQIENLPPRAIVGIQGSSLALSVKPVWHQLPQPGQRLQIAVRLQQPYVDPRQCIGCGVCEHECPVQGRRAVRVTAENESRNEHHRLTAL